MISRNALGLDFIENVFDEEDEYKEDKNNGAIVLDENAYNLLKKDELCPIINNEGLICFFGPKDQFLQVFSQLFRAKPHVLKPYLGGCKDSEMIIFKNKRYTYVFDRLKEQPVTLTYRGEYAPHPIDFTILIQPVTRHCSVTDNKCLSKEEIDILPLIQRYKPKVNIDDILCRANRMHGNEKQEYIR
jgi:hypothetical protein